MTVCPFASFRLLWRSSRIVEPDSGVFFISDDSMTKTTPDSLVASGTLAPYATAKGTLVTERHTGNEERSIHANSLRDNRGTRSSTLEMHEPSGSPHHFVCFFRSSDFASKSDR